MLLITFILAYTMNVDMILSVRVSRPEMDEVFPAKYSCIILELAFDWRYAPILASCNRTMQAKNHPPL